MLFRVRPPASRRARGQSSTEMVVIVALIAIGAIGLVGIFGNNLRHLFGASSAAMAGDDQAANTGTRTMPNPNKDLKTFGLNREGSVRSPGGTGGYR